MSKEYRFYRSLAMLYLVFIANFALLISEGINYYIWFCSSLVILIIFSILEKEKLLKMIKFPKELTLSRQWIYLIPFIIAFPRHYQSYRHVDYIYVGIFQLIYIVLFFIVFCVKRKNYNIESK